jgi:hypothetical protein
MFRIIVVASLIAQIVAPVQLEARCQSTSAEEQIDFFPLAEMDSEINNSLKTTSESGERKAVLVIRDERLPSLSQEVTEEAFSLPSQRK